MDRETGSNARMGAATGTGGLGVSVAEDSGSWLWLKFDPPSEDGTLLVYQNPTPNAENTWQPPSVTSVSRVEEVSP
jgi:hypothetical protein